LDLSFSLINLVFKSIDHETIPLASAAKPMEDFCLVIHMNNLKPYVLKKIQKFTKKNTLKSLLDEAYQLDSTT
jgi:hypothetical protein